MTDIKEIFTPEFADIQEEQVEPQQPQQEINETETHTNEEIHKEETSEKKIEENAVNIEINEIAAKVEEILLLVRVSNRKDEIIDNLHKELQQYKDSLHEAIIEPLLKAIIREHDWITKLHRIYLKKSQIESQSELFNKLLSELEMISFSMLDLFSDYDIEPFEFQEGDVRDAKLQKIVEIVETKDARKNETVAECVTCGFRNIKTTRLFRQAEVKIYKFKNN